MSDETSNVPGPRLHPSASLQLHDALAHVVGRTHRPARPRPNSRCGSRIGLPDRVRLENLLEILGLAATTLYNRLKQVGIDGVAR